MGRACGGVAALACARMAFEESFEAVVVRPVRSRRARRLEREGRRRRRGRRRGRRGRGGERDGGETTVGRAQGDFREGKAPTNAISIDGMARGDFQATFDAMAMMYWVSEVRRTAEGRRGGGGGVGDFLRASLGSRGGGVLSERGDARSGDSISASSRGDEEEDSTSERRGHGEREFDTVAEIRRSGDEEGRRTGARRRVGGRAGRARRDGEEDGSAESESAPMTIDQWKSSPNCDGIGKDEGNARGERTRARASSRGCLDERVAEIAFEGGDASRARHSARG